MDQQVHTPGEYDYRQYDRVWQRVAPTLEPYPGEGQGGDGSSAAGNGVPAFPAVQRGIARLPGAEQNPCCMGSVAAESLGVLTGFIEEELAEQRYDLAFCRQAPPWARQQLRDLAAAAGSRAGRLMAVYYLITGECFRPAVSCERIYIGRWCPALRERYHTAACGGLNYARAADGTADPCLRKLLLELSGESYRYADILLTMLERAIRKG